MRKPLVGRTEYWSSAGGMLAETHDLAYLSVSSAAHLLRQDHLIFVTGQEDEAEAGGQMHIMPIAVPYSSKTGELYTFDCTIRKCRDFCLGRHTQTC